jgi:hypothetical protein
LAYDGWELCRCGGRLGRVHSTIVYVRFACVHMATANDIARATNARGGARNFSLQLDDVAKAK